MIFRKSYKSKRNDKDGTSCDAKKIANSQILETDTKEMPFVSCQTYYESKNDKNMQSKIVLNRKVQRKQAKSRRKDANFANTITEYFGKQEIDLY